MRNAKRMVPVTIASAGSLTPAIDTVGRTLVGILMPAAWTAAPLTFEVGEKKSGTYRDLYDSAGAERTVQAAAGHAISVHSEDFDLGQYLKIRSGPSALPVAQGADRVLTLVFRD